MASIRVTDPNNPSVTFEVRDVGYGQMMVFRTSGAAYNTRSVLLTGDTAKQVDLQLTHLGLKHDTSPEGQRELALAVVKLLQEQLRKVM